MPDTLTERIKVKWLQNGEEMEKVFTDRKVAETYASRDLFKFGLMYQHEIRNIRIEGRQP